MTSCATNKHVNANLSGYLNKMVSIIALHLKDDIDYEQIKKCGYEFKTFFGSVRAQYQDKQSKLGTPDRSESNIINQVINSFQCLESASQKMINETFEKANFKKIIKSANFLRYVKM